MEKEEGEVVGSEIESTALAETEFRLINPTEDGFLREIKWNRAELEILIKQKVAIYENLEDITDELLEGDDYKYDDPDEGNEGGEE